MFTYAEKIIVRKASRMAELVSYFVRPPPLVNRRIVHRNHALHHACIVEEDCPAHQLSETLIVARARTVYVASRVKRPPHLLLARYIRPYAHHLRSSVRPFSDRLLGLLKLTRGASDEDHLRRPRLRERECLCTADTATCARYKHGQPLRRVGERILGRDGGIDVVPDSVGEGTGSGAGCHDVLDRICVFKRCLKLVRLRQTESAGTHVASVAYRNT